MIETSSALTLGSPGSSSTGQPALARILGLMDQEARDPTGKWFSTCSAPEQKDLRTLAKSWMKFCSRPENFPERSAGDLEATNFLPEMNEKCPGLDLQTALKVVTVFLLRTAASEHRARLTDWYVPMVAARLNERYADDATGSLLSDPSIFPTNVFRALAFQQSIWLLLLRGSLQLAVGLALLLAFPLSYGLGFPLGIMLGQLAVFLLRVFLEPAWLSIAPYRKLGVVAVGTAPLLFSAEIWALIWVVVDLSYWPILAALGLGLSAVLILAEVNLARGFRFRTRAWWPPGSWQQTREPGWKLARRIWSAAARELASLLARTAILIWVIAPTVVDAVCEDCWPIETAEVLKIVVVVSPWALALGLMLQQLWEGSSLGKGIEVEE